MMVRRKCVSPLPPQVWRLGEGEAKIGQGLKGLEQKQRSMEWEWKCAAAWGGCGLLGGGAREHRGNDAMGREAISQ